MVKVDWEDNYLQHSKILPQQALWELLDLEVTSTLQVVEVDVAMDLLPHLVLLPMVVVVGLGPRKGS